MMKLALLLLVTVFASPVVSGQSHTPGNGGPDPANIPAPTAPTPPPAGVPILPVDYDASGTNVLRVFNPHSAVRPHALRIYRYGNISATDSYWNALWKLNAKGEALRTLGKRGENRAGDGAAWNGMFNQPLDIACD